MRVLFFNEGNLGGFILGQGRLQDAIEAGAADQAGFEPRFVDLTPQGRWAHAAALRRIPPLARWDLDFRSLRWHVVQSLRARRQLERAMREWPPDVLHIHPHSIAFVAGRLLRSRPVALSVDTTVADWSAMRPWAPKHNAQLVIAPSRALERRAFEAAGVVLAWTGWARRSVQRAAPAATVVEHHPGLDLTRYRPAPRAPRDRARVLFIGGRFVEKGGNDLLTALEDRLGTDVELDLVTRAIVAERPGVRTHQLGPADDRLLDLLQQADVLCLPTYGDAVPWTLLEAMACGTPVVSTHVGAIPEMLDEGRAGLLVPYGDPGALRAALHALIDDPQRRASLGAVGRARCEERYDMRKQVPALIDILRGLAS
jgi:alpha-maltose-1-phosphate synthase